LAARLDWNQVGYWQAVSRVSDAYLLFITTAINIYYLPKLSGIKEPGLLKAELRSAYRHIMPVVIVLATLVYLLRHVVTWVLFTHDFVPAEALYAPQLLGDVIKIASFVLSYIMLAKAMTRVFVLSECVFAISYLTLVYLFTSHFGLVGAIYAFTLNYALYLAFNVVVARSYLKSL
jgi:polysaccharide transporter, PST family